MDENWQKLLDKLGIASQFSDGANPEKCYHVSDQTLLEMVRNLGFKITKTADSGRLLEKLEKKRWQYALDPIYIVRQNEKSVIAVLPQKYVDVMDLIVWHNLEAIQVQYDVTTLEEKMIGKTNYVQVRINFLSYMEPDYYDVELEIPNKSYHTVLAVTPDSCYIPEVLNTEKLWGWAIQLYSLKSHRNWGIGDFTDLLNLVKLSEKYHADVIGINPLNVLFHDFPENASPYSSISRLFLNPIYIDVEKVYGYASVMVDPYRQTLAVLREADEIDYTGVYRLKMQILRQTFAKLQQKEAQKEYDKFLAFCRRQGEDLDNLAVYQAIYSAQVSQIGGDWKNWPVELRDRASTAIEKFKKQNSEEVLFFKYLQYLAHNQLQEVYAAVKNCHMKIGLYRDLPVGLCKDSFELWADRDLFVENCGAGAPPDAFFPTGQKWCLGAFNPLRLKECAYRPFIKILRSAMSCAGALRIDHVMGLMRLYVIPDDKDEGTYIYYNFDEMLGLVALESYLNKCMVVGESIGNVPDGFIEKIHERGIYSLSVLWAERWNGCGDFKCPADFDEKTFGSVGTHDIAPLKMRWFGYDIETMFELKMINEQEREQMYKAREDERCRLLRALDCAGVWPLDKPRQGDCLFGEGYPQGIMQAVEKYLAQSNSRVYLAQPEDIFGVTLLQNLPGTDRDKHPNWRRKLPLAMEDWESDPDFISAMSCIKR